MIFMKVIGWIVCVFLVIGSVGAANDDEKGAAAFLLAFALALAGALFYGG